MISKETIIRALTRVGVVALTTAVATFVATPINIEEPKKYLIILGASFLSGFLAGLQKLVSGYIKYDK